MTDTTDRTREANSSENDEIRVEGQGVPQHGIDRDFPLLCEMADEHDSAERLGKSTSPLHAEVSAALREIWDARNYMANEPRRG